MKKIILAALGILFLFQPHLSLADEEEAVSPAVGPDKGITAADEHDGIKLSSEAIKNFALQTLKLSSNPSEWEIPSKAILVSGEEVNIYRLRDGFYKRIDFTTVSKSAGKLKIKSKELKVGDEIVTSGLGFLRAAELSAFSSGEEGHGH
ncbi:MAG: hypothetical protein JSU04_08550 [Bdellovibrionales bacterium]|nr:hypothetical protein [Bdellovibrionales bacterium]